MTLYLFISIIFCLFFFILSTKNISYLRNITYSSQSNLSTPKVSVIIPARNEEPNIGNCLDSFLEQDYPDYEILVIDDNSKDKTWEILKYYEGQTDKIKIYSGKPVPLDWAGKPYACHQLSKVASGKYLLFTDADTIHSPESISWAISNMQKHNADFMSAYIYHKIATLGEAVLVPAVYLMTTLLLPLWMLPKKNHHIFSFGIGQLLVCRRKAFQSIRGFSQFKDSIVEDMCMARMMKLYGFKTIFLDAKRYVICRMYRSFSEAFNGFLKNLFSALNQNILLLISLLVVVIGVIEFPFINLINTLLNGSENLLLSATPVVIFSITWTNILKDRDQPLIFTILYPLLFINIIVIGILSAIKTGFGKGVEWKGRYVKCGTRSGYTNK